LKVLGVDPGSRAAGWAVVEFGAKTRLVSAGVLRPPASVEIAPRLLFLRERLREVVERERPDVAAVERVFSGKNPQSLITLGEARGVLVLTLAEAGVPVTDITPAEIKKAVTGTGGAEKEQVRRMVEALLGRHLPFDAADAAAAALTHGFLAARGVRLAAPERSVTFAGPVKRRPSG
jgi:crossover junction endodeoxyribonuclease RuvC